MKNSSELRSGLEMAEVDFLHPKAAYSKDHSRFFGKEDDHRLPYKRDVDRIVHSKAYSRYSDKTQVAYLVPHDHITHRGLHVQLVSNFARGVAEILRLNLDLVEAIALGHDAGHAPFGHEGEEYLSELCLEHTGKAFTHPRQSCRLFTTIEPLNLGLLVYDGFLCHDGGMQGRFLKPEFGKTWERHFQECEQKVTEPAKNIWPGSIEGCLVKISDTICYLGRDLEDAISLGILKREDVKKTALGITNRDILQRASADIAINSFGKDYIELSEEVYNALLELRRFNFERIYFHPVLKTHSSRIKRAYRLLFDYLLDDWKKNDKKSYLYNEYLSTKPEQYIEESDPVSLTIDFISGMTDNFFIRTLENLFFPREIDTASFRL